MKFANFKVATKIALGFLIPFLLFAGFGLWLWLTIGNISGHVAKVRNEYSVFALRAQNMERQSLQVQQALTDISATRGQDGLDTGLAEAKVAYDEFNKHVSAFQQVFDAEGNKKEANKIRLIKAQMDTYYALGIKMAQAYIDGGTVEGNKLMGQFDASREALTSVLEPMVQLQVNELAVSTAAVEAATRQTRTVSLVVAMLAMLLLIAISVLISRSITYPLNNAVKLAQRVAAGDLTAEIDVTLTDETGMLLRALKEMNDSLKKIVGEVRASADSVSTSAQQIASGNVDLSQRTEEQASSLEETAAAMEELSSTVNQNVKNTMQANRMAEQASDVAEKGGVVVNSVVSTMSEINESSKKIVDIISVIDSIAFQTNILALNAAVEAARAGEQGRGFAVVATEVRNLAQRSAAAAKEIKVLISNSVGKVDEGTKLVDQAGKTMEELVLSVRRVTSMMGEITSASQAQGSGISQVGQAVAQMDEVTQLNAALVEEAAAASASMQEEAQNLARLMATFKLAAADGGAASCQAPSLKVAVVQVPTQSGRVPVRLVASDSSGTEKWKAL